MKRLHDKVNIIPVVAKSDSCTQGLIHSMNYTLFNQNNVVNHVICI